MAKRKGALNRMLKLLNEKSILQDEISKTLKIGRVTKWRIIKEALDRCWIQQDRLGRYQLTQLGKESIDSAERPPDYVTLSAYSQVIDFLPLRSDRPAAKCTIEIKNADKIKQLDSQTQAEKRFLTYDGLWLPENNTNLKASTAAVVDSILDLKAKQMGLFTILDEEFREKITTSNLNVLFPGYDAFKRYEDLARTKFSILIEFDGEKWASKRDFEDLEKKFEKRVEFFSENIHVMDQRVGFNKAIYNLLSGGDLWIAKLHANHLFGNREELTEYLTHHFKINGITDKNQLSAILKNGFDTGFFSEEKMRLSYLKVRKDKELQFLNSLPFLMSTGERQQQAKARHTVNQKSSDIINSESIISTISKELEYFEKAFINRLVKITEEYKAASHSDMLQSTSKPQLPAVRSSFFELFSIFCELLSTYTYRGMIV